MAQLWPVLYGLTVAIFVWPAKLCMAQLWPALYRQLWQALHGPTEAIFVWSN